MARRGPVALLLGGLLLLAACGGGAEEDAAADETTTTTTSTSTTVAPPADPARPAARIITPGQDAANPFVLFEDGRYYLYATQQTWLYYDNVPLRAGRDIDELGEPVDVMPKLPAWVKKGHTWAPDVRRIGEDRYVLWFTATTKKGRTDSTNDSQCIGVAVGKSPEGPFRGVGDGPAICQLERYGSIDPRTFLDDDGQLWLHWKSDDNAQVQGTGHAAIFAQRLAEDGSTLVGPAIEILRADQQWEGRIVEAPQMVEVDGRHWLFYSGNWFNQPYYGIGVAECDGPAGPCRKPLDRPWLGSNAQGEGPGESSMFQDERGWWIVYGPAAVLHEELTARPVALAPVGFGPDGPYLARR